jgi:hypothetical protein
MEQSRRSLSLDARIMQVDHHVIYQLPVPSLSMEHRTDMTGRGNDGGDKSQRPLCPAASLLGGHIAIRMDQ